MIKNGNGGIKNGGIPEELVDNDEVLKFKEKWRLNRMAKIKKIVFVVVFLAGFTIGMYFAFRAVGIDVFSREGAADNLKDNDLAVLILMFFGIYIIQSMFLNLIPGTTTFFLTIFGYSLFVAPPGTPFAEVSGSALAIFFGVAIMTVVIDAIFLYFLGRFGGRRLLYWMFSKEELDGKLEWIANNGTKGVPWLFLIPFFPTDLMCVVCGASKMNFWHFLLIALVFRPIEVTLLVIIYPIAMGMFFDLDDILLQVLIINVLIINAALLIIYHKGLLKLFNKITGRGKYEAELAAVIEAVRATQGAEDCECEPDVIAILEEKAPDPIPLPEASTPKARAPRKPKVKEAIAE